jgi:hypothetical protein
MRAVTAQSPLEGEARQPEDIQFMKSSSCSLGSCVEVGVDATGTVFVRDSKSPEMSPLGFTADEWIAFLDGVKKGEFDLV